jgi:cation diffusion facilitator family transporter
MVKSNNKCANCLRSTVWICFLECVLVAVFKVLVGFASGSKAMLGSALYSLTDLISSFLLLVSMKVFNRPADAKHPYGHGKIEHVISLLIGLIVLVGAGYLSLVSALSLYSANEMALPHWIGIWAALACLSLNHIVYRLVVCVAERTGSLALASHSKHIRLDSISSIAVIIAILAAEVGLRELDAIIAIVEGVHVFHECAKMMHKSIQNLMDANIGEDRIESIEAVIRGNPNVVGVRDVKGMHTGRGLRLDIELLLDGGQTIEECNETVGAIEATLKSKIARLSGVSIHYHPFQYEAEDGSAAGGAGRAE